MKKPDLYVQLSRPFTLLPPLLGIVSGAVCAWGSVHNPDPARQLTLSVVLTVALGSLCASFLNAASNAINQITDLEIDRVNKPKRPLVTGALTLGEAWRFTWLFYALALIPTWLVVVFPYSSPGAKLFAPLSAHQTFFVYLAGLVFTLVYSMPAWGRTKARGMLANWTIAVPRGCLLKVAGWAMVANIWHTEPWFIGAIFMLFLVGAASTKDFADIDGDRAGGCKTLPILHGPKQAALLIAPFFVFPWLLMPIGAYVADPRAPEHAILTGNPVFLATLGIALTLWGCYTVYLLLRDPDELTRSENHPSWRHMYLMMMAAQIGFAVAYLIPEVSAALDLAAELGHERVVLVQEPAVGLRAVIAIHSTVLGPAVGGTRMRRYASFDEAIEDALRLGRAMTLKNAYAGLHYGGGKAVIDADPTVEKNPALLEAYGRAVEELGGRFLTAGDMGIHGRDLAVIGRATRHVGGAPDGVSFDASDLTALGIASSIRALGRRLGKGHDELTVAIQGTGAVGSRLARLLAPLGIRLLVADADRGRAEAVAAETGAQAVVADSIYDVPCDIFSPNAAGGVFTAATLERLDCRAICGAANNPLADPLIGFELAARGVVYAPDFVVSAGGVLSLLLETGATDEAGVIARVERIGADLVELLEAAEAAGTPPFRLAERRVAERLAARSATP